MKPKMRSYALGSLDIPRFSQTVKESENQVWNKPMLYVFAALLCTSCGGAGGPTASESDSNLQSGVSMTASTDAIISPGYSGLTVSEAQQTAASESVEVATDSGGTTFSAAAPLPATEVPVIAAAVSTPDVVTQEPVEENSLISTPLTPDAQIELAALALELEALNSEEPIAPQAPIEPEDLVVLENLTELEPPEDNEETNNGSVSYQTIKDNGLPNFTYPTDDYYLAEYLSQNPSVCFWEQDKINKTITPVSTPVPPEDSIYIPTPTGGDDTPMLKAFISENAGKSLVGQGTYIIDNLVISKSVDIYDMPMIPASGAKEMVTIYAPDVRIFNSPITGNNSNTLTFGFTVEDGADRFVLVNSGLKDIHQTNKAEVSAVFVRGANDFYIVCNRFENILNQTNDKAISASASSVWLNGRNTHDLTGGLIANNFASNHQSNGTRDDAEFLKIQNYNSVSETNPLRIFANRGYDAGKRLTKLQEGNALVLSNYLEWENKDGPLGKRTLLSGFAVHFADNVYVRNNRIKVSADGHFDAIFHTHTTRSTPQNNIHFDSNDIELTDNRDQNANSGPVLLFAMSNNQSLASTGYEATNSSANDNVIHGTGSLKYYYLFRNGYEDTGGKFEHTNNQFSVPFYRSEYIDF